MGAEKLEEAVFEKKQLINTYVRDLELFLKLDFSELISELNSKIDKVLYPEIHQIETNINKEIGAKLTTLRKSKNMSQELLASKLNTSQSEVSKLEAGDKVFTNDKITQLALVLGVDIMDFVK